MRRVGGTKEIGVDVRLMAATHRNLEDLMAKGMFREDLYYRLNVIPLFLPPLRERPEDIPMLVDVFLHRYASRMKKPVPVMGEAAMAKLIRYSWPGNIRELENIVERAVNLVEGPLILAHHVVVQNTATTLPIAIQRTGMAKLGEAVAETEREALLQAVQVHRSSRKLGDALGLSHTAVLKKLKKYGILFPQKRE